MTRRTMLIWDQYFKPVGQPQLMQRICKRYVAKTDGSIQKFDSYNPVFILVFKKPECVYLCLYETLERHKFL